jgi:hypothetical protein
MAQPIFPSLSRTLLEQRMSDDVDCPASNAPLADLLTHYSPANAEDRESWRDRVMQWPGASERELTRWHGELVAAAWLEQNTGQTPSVANGQVRGCYRLTQSGRRALRKLT